MAARRSKRWVLLTGALGALLAIVAGVFVVSQLNLERRVDEGLFEEWTNPPFYQVPINVPRKEPGTIFRKERIESGPAGTVAWRVLYHSEDLFGSDALVSGVVIAPSGPAPAGGRTIVSWAHPTTGVAQKCAPSVGADPFDDIEGLTTLLAQGYAVAATDYPGMGAPGPNAYLVGKTAGHSVLDAAKAARELMPTTTSDRLLLWGHSQGGQAVLFAAEEASSYAPELELAAAAVAAPAVDLAVLLKDDIDDVSGVTIGSYAFDAYATIYGGRMGGAQLDTILTPAGAAATPIMTRLCLLTQNAELHKIATPLIGKYLSGDPTTEQPWASLLSQNTPGSVPLSVPLFIAQGDIDTLVRPSSTREFADGECAYGTNVTYLAIPDTGHGLVALRAMEVLPQWFKDALAGSVKSTGCPPAA